MSLAVSVITPLLKKLWPLPMFAALLICLWVTRERNARLEAELELALTNLAASEAVREQREIGISALQQRVRTCGENAVAAVEAARDAQRIVTTARENPAANHSALVVDDETSSAAVAHINRALDRLRP
ncbi:MAG: hypothetical protein LBP61_08230 [Desulfovibrio sp.]|jgi:hypothetical protein|nr:hypothetical protein [Desulfovibrio sp.]